jgi:hypothetical protein
MIGILPVDMRQAYAGASDTLWSSDTRVQQTQTHEPKHEYRLTLTTVITMQAATVHHVAVVDGDGHDDNSASRPLYVRCCTELTALPS